MSQARLSVRLTEEREKDESKQEAEAEAEMESCWSMNGMRGNTFHSTTC